MRPEQAIREEGPSVPGAMDVRPIVEESMDRVLITGATGFVGSNLARRLVASGQVVRCLARRSASWARAAGLDVEWALGDVTDFESLRAAVAGCSVVYHLAGCLRTHQIAQFYRVNQQGTHNVLRACARLRPAPVVVLVSSLAAAGPSQPDRPLVETDPPHPVSHYGRSKRGAELVAQAFASEVPITIVRPPIVLGEHDRQGLAMFQCIAWTGVHLVPGSRSHRFSVLHIHDLTAALVAAAERGSRLAPACEPSTPQDRSGYYFLADDEHPTYAELGQLIAQALGRPTVRVVRVPLPVVWTVAAAAELLGRIGRPAGYLNFDKAREIAAGSWTCSAQRAREQLGFRPEAPLAERIGQTAAWYRQAGWL